VPWHLVRHRHGRWWWVSRRDSGTALAVHPLWYRNAVTYSIDPATFLDSNASGWGDLNGISERLSYIRGLGADCVWLLPFYRTPYRDGGYDVSDHLTVDPRFGDLADFANLLDTADSLGLRVLVDLVAQHTSVDHPWFQEARHDRRSPYRDYYVWADEPEDTDVEPVFPTAEDSVWEWDEEAQQFYRHVFYKHEPDLELGNPRVREEMYRIMGFWMRLGVAGFRVDAVPYMVERARAADDRLDGLWLLEDMRRFVTLKAPDCVLLGECDVEVDEYADYLGEDDRLTMLLDFWKNNHLFLALARESAAPLEDAIRNQPGPAGFGQHAVFLRNHDELDLEQLDKDDREEVMSVFAPDEDMRSYGRGIRRRLGSMLGGDVDRITMAHALLMSLPGAPVMLYGDEIGMGEDLRQEERSSVRTPMQWSTAPLGGFSAADPERLVCSPIEHGDFGFPRVNVFDQLARPDSLLSRVGSLVRARRGALEIGSGTCEILDTGAPSVLCFLYENEGKLLVTAVNLAGRPADCRLPAGISGDLTDVLVDSHCSAMVEGRFTLNPYGYRWFRRRDEALA
jgi:maltose alpha-D-glucosyltransferase / alpha-amylase